METENLITATALMADDDGSDDMRTSEIETQNSETNRFCCVVCKITSCNPKFNPNYLQQQLDNISSRLERVDYVSDLQGIKHNHNHNDNNNILVDLHKFKAQVLMIVNPPVGFGRLSLDFLPCFQPEPKKEGGFEGGWIAAASSNTGLLLCTTAKFSQSQYYICNPFTKQWAALPPAPRLHRSVKIGFFVDSFTNDNNNITNCDFQVVRFLNNYELHQQSDFEVETFSSQTGEWTIQTVYSPVDKKLWSRDPINFQSLYHHRRLHWLAEEGLVVYDPYQKKLIGIIKKPSKLQACHYYDFNGIGLSAGSLWINQFASSCLDLRFWQLKGYDTPTDDLDQCYWRPMFKFNFMDLTGGPKWASKSQGGMLAIHPHHPNIVYLQLRGRRLYYLVECNLLTKTMGPAMVGHNCYRSWGDIFTLDVTSSN